MKNHSSGKRLRLGIVGGMLFVLLAFVGLQSAQAADLTIRFAWYMPPGTAVNHQSEAIAKKIESLSDGKIAVNTYPSGSLLTASDLGHGVANNTANMRRYQFLSVEALNDVRESCLQHLNILALLRARDIPALTQALRDHLSWAASLLKRF